MFITGITGGNFLQSYNTQNTQNKFQQIQTEFQQLGQDLQSGNLSQAQADFATLSQQLPIAQQQTGASPLAQGFQALAKDLQAGNLSAAQQDFAAIQQAAQQGSSHRPHHHHGHHGGAEQQQGNTLSQAFGALGQALQSGNLSSAQQAYATLQQDLLQDSLPALSASLTGPTVVSPATSATPPTVSGTVNTSA
jgi:hypothetical protein